MCMQGVYALLVSVNVQQLTLPHPLERKDREEGTKENLEPPQPLFVRNVVRETNNRILQ